MDRDLDDEIHVSDHYPSADEERHQLSLNHVRSEGVGISVGKGSAGGGNEAHAALKDNVELPTRLLLAHELEIERRVHARVLVGVAEDPPKVHPHSTLLLVPSGIQEQLPGLVTGVEALTGRFHVGLLIEAAIVRKGHGGDRGRRHRGRWRSLPRPQGP